MNTKGNSKLMVILVLSVSLLVTSLTVIFLSYYYSHIQYRMLGDFCGEIIEAYPECRQTILEVLEAQDIEAPSAADDKATDLLRLSDSD